MRSTVVLAIWRRSSNIVPSAFRSTNTNRCSNAFRKKWSTCAKSRICYDFFGEQPTSFIKMKCSIQSMLNHMVQKTTNRIRFEGTTHWLVRRPTIILAYCHNRINGAMATVSRTNDHMHLSAEIDQKHAQAKSTSIQTHLSHLVQLTERDSMPTQHRTEQSSISMGSSDN